MALGKRITALITVFAILFAVLVGNLTYYMSEAKIGLQQIVFLPDNNLYLGERFLWVIYALRSPFCQRLDEPPRIEITFSRLFNRFKYQHFSSHGERERNFYIINIL